MRKRSVKVKITLWYLLLMGLMAGLMLVFLRLISGSVYTQSAMEQLDQTVRENLGQVTLVDGRPQMGEGFQFYENGVYTLVYSQDKTLLAGQVPVSFTAQEKPVDGIYWQTTDGFLLHKVEYEVVNGQYFPVVHTGGSGFYWPGVLGAGAAAAGVLYLIRRKTKGHNTER